MYHVFEQACVNITTTLPIGNVLQKPRNSGKKTAPFVYPKEKQDATHARTLEIVCLLHYGQGEVFSITFPMLVRKVKSGSPLWKARGAPGPSVASGSQMQKVLLLLRHFRHISKR